MNDYPLRVKITAYIAIVLTYVIGGPLFVLMYAAGAWADRCDRRRFAAILSSTDCGEDK
jgi:membrane protein required for beta-lactamase induction